MSSDAIPAFLYLSLGTWLILLILFLASSIYLYRLPDDRILHYKAKAIEKKKSLGIKVFKF